VASSAIGGTLNYYFVRAWSKRALAHFRTKHLEVRREMAEERARLLVAPKSASLAGESKEEPRT